MDKPPLDPSKQPVPPKYLLLAFGLVAYMVAALAIAQAYSGVLGLIMLAPVFVYMLTSFHRLPREQKARIGAKIMEQEQTPFGRFMRFVEIGLWLLIAYALLVWLIKAGNSASCLPTRCSESSWRRPRTPVARSPRPCPSG